MHNTYGAKKGVQSVQLRNQVLFTAPAQRLTTSWNCPPRGSVTLPGLLWY